MAGNLHFSGPVLAYYSESETTDGLPIELGRQEHVLHLSFASRKKWW
jgi:hypothetical protein